MSDHSESARGWFERVGISHLLIALPVAHLLVASLYTWGWLSGFGANASVLADPRDLFSISIAKLMPVYLIGLILPLAQLLFMRRQFGARTQAAPSPTGSTPWLDRVLMGFLWLFFLFATVMTFDTLFSGRTQGLALLVGTNMGGILVYKFVIDHVEFRGETFRVVNVALGLLFSAVGFGLAHGNFARYETYETYVPRLVHCAEYLVQRRFGDHYIAIAPNNSKVVTDLECKVVMTIPDVQSEGRRELHWRPYPHFHYVLLKGNAPMHQPSR